MNGALVLANCPIEHSPLTPNYAEPLEWFARYVDALAASVCLGLLGFPRHPAPGDVVRLKSGGPRMTISSVCEGYGTVAFFNVNDECQQATFPFAALELCE